MFFYQQMNNNSEQLLFTFYPDTELINIIMGEIINTINSVDYINDTVLQDITSIVFRHTINSESMNGNDLINNQEINKLIINNEDFLRQLHNWNRTDKDEFISNLENYLNNILVACSSTSTSGTELQQRANHSNPSVNLTSSFEIADLPYGQSTGHILQDSNSIHLINPNTNMRVHTIDSNTSLRLQNNHMAEADQITNDESLNSIYTNGDCVEQEDEEEDDEENAAVGGVATQTVTTQSQEEVSKNKIE